MKKIWLLLGFIFITSLAFADCFFDGSIYFLNLEIDKAKEILGLTAEETADSEVYKEVVSHFKERYSLDIEKDVKQITLYMYSGYRSNDYIAVISGNFDSDKIQDSIKKIIETEKWRYQKITDFAFCENKYKAFKVDGLFSIVFYDKNTLLITSDSIQKNNSIEISKSTDSINNFIKTNKNYIYISKDILPNVQQWLGKPDMGLEKANSVFCYLNAEKLNIEIGFDNSATSKEVFDKINNISKEQIEKFKQNLDTSLEKIKKEISDSKEGFTANTSVMIMQTLYYCKNSDFIKHLDIKQVENSIRFSCDFNLNHAFSVFVTFLYKSYEESKEREIRYQCQFRTMGNIISAVREYNKKHDVKMSTLDIKTLVKEKYLEEEPKLPGPECEYYLLEPDIIACKKHGKY